MTNSKDLDLVNITHKKWADMILKIGKGYREKIKLDDLVMNFCIRCMHLITAAFYLNQH